MQSVSEVSEVSDSLLPLFFFPPLLPFSDWLKRCAYTRNRKPLTSLTSLTGLAKGYVAMQHSAEYKRVLASSRWRKLRNERMLATGWRCEQCKQPEVETKLALHHLTYERLGNERPEDIILLCARCHKGADRERAVVSAQRGEARRHDARLNGWARKVYGDDWAACEDHQEVQEAFDAWLEDRGEQ